MPGKRISELTALSGAGSANNDDVLIFDVDAGETKRISRSQLAEGMVPDLPLQYYLGVLNANPTQRLNGDALQIGDFYLDAVTKYTTVYNGSGWNSYASVIAAQAAAEAARDKAQEWATNPEDDPVETGQFSALHWSAKAEDEKLAAQVARTGAETAETNAETAQGLAETAQAAAEAAQTGAELAETNAETARDAAFVNADVYADTAAGLAATTTGDQFQVVAGDEIIRYRHDAGPVATEVARYPSSDPVNLNTAWVDTPGTSTSSIGSLAPTGTPYSSTRFVGPAEGIPTDGIVRSLTLDVAAGPLTAQIILMKPRAWKSTAGAPFDFEVISTTSVSGLAAGTHTVDLGYVEAPAGTRVLMRRSAGSIDGDGTVSGSCEHNSSTATVGEVKPLSMNINRALAMQLNYIPLADRSLYQRAASGGRAALAGGDQKQDVGDFFDGLAASSSLIGRIETGADVGTDIPSGAVILGITASIQTSTIANKAETLVAAIYRRLTSDGDVDASISTGTPEFITARQFSGADLGLTPDGDRGDVVMDLDALKVEDGYTYYAVVSGLTSGGILGSMGIGYDYKRSTLRQRRSGYTASGTSVAAVTTFTAQLVPASLRLGFVYQEPAAVTIAEGIPEPIYIDKITSAEITTDTLTVNTRLEYTRDYTRFSTDDTRTVTASAAGDVRFDLLYLDRANLLDFTEVPTFGVIAGTERTTDPGEFIPTLQAGLTYGRMPVAYLRVTDTAVTALPCWDVANGDIENFVPQIRLDRERNQRILRSALGRINRATPIKIGGIGDSIMAIGSVSKAAGLLAPNGSARDRGATQYYQVNIGADLVSALPLYTSVQMGYADDGAGTVHTKTSFMWTLVDAIQEASGLALGASGVLYNNWGINSQKAQDLYSGGAASTWLQNFCSDGADLVVINIGMNDYTLPQPLFGFTPNYVGAVEYIKANCVDRDGNPSPIILMGVARPNSSITLGQWAATNRNVRTVAEATGCAFVDLMPYYDAPNLRSISLTGDDTCSANGTNHPGIYEQEQVMGRALVNAVFG